MLYKRLIWNFTALIGIKHGFSCINVQNQEEILEQEHKQENSYTCKYKNRIKQETKVYIILSKMIAK